MVEKARKAGRHIGKKHRRETDMRLTMHTHLFRWATWIGITGNAGIERLCRGVPQLQQRNVGQCLIALSSAAEMSMRSAVRQGTTRALSRNTRRDFEVRYRLALATVGCAPT